MSAHQYEHPDTTLEQLLKESSRPERHRALLALHKLCAVQANVSRDFRIATVGALAEAAGVLKKKSLSNRGSVGLVRLIEAWANFAGLNTIAVPVTRPAIVSALKSISDPAMRALLQAAVAERDKLRSQINLVKSTTLIEVDRRITATDKDISPMFSAAELACIKRVASNTFLEGEGWKEGLNGEVLDALTGRRIFPQGFLLALRKAAALGDI